VMCGAGNFTGLQRGATLCGGSIAERARQMR